MIGHQLIETDFDLDIYTGYEYYMNLRIQDTNKGFEAANIQTQDEVEKMTPEPQGFSVIYYHQLIETDFNLDIYMGNEYHMNLRIQDEYLRA
ncbi:hypothetical protein VTO42DRAFT_2637 [Malbranchea cinnamomea]